MGSHTVKSNARLAAPENLRVLAKGLALPGRITVWDPG